MGNSLSITRNEKQKTIAKQVEYSGIGLHTGKNTKVTFLPAPIDYGVRFIRTDLNGKPEIPVSIEYVIDIIRGTTLGNNGVHIRTVEHLLAALAGLGVDNLIINLDSEEPPVGDGSALPFVQVLTEAGIVEQEAPKRYFELTEPIICEFSKETASVDLSTKLTSPVIVALPASELIISYTIDYPHPLVRSQFARYVINPDNFVKEIAAARTFCFEEDIAGLLAQGLLKGGSLENAVVVGKNKILNNNLRFSDEFVRHKILDLLGDLYLLGQPVRAHIIAIKAGHPSNVKLVQLLQQAKKKKETIESSVKKTEVKLDTMVKGSESFVKKFNDKSGLDIQQIEEILPHRYPFLLVDRILELEEDKRAVGVKNVSINEEYFAGHFPKHPVMPGVLIIETMAQVAGVLLLSKPSTRGKIAYITTLNNCKFRRPVFPGDQLYCEARVVHLRQRSGKVKTFAYVDNKLVAEADITFTLMER